MRIRRWITSGIGDRRGDVRRVREFFHGLGCVLPIAWPVLSKPRSRRWTLSAVGNISLQDVDAYIHRSPSVALRGYLNATGAARYLLVTGREDDDDDDQHIPAKLTQQALLIGAYPCCCRRQRRRRPLPNGATGGRRDRDGDGSMVRGFVRLNSGLALEAMCASESRWDGVYRQRRRRVPTSRYYGHDRIFSDDGVLVHENSH
ncbi:hypothetical protein C8F01DRAFT_673184 [Mycena amicta]|nr:hypothetical protein C8F01DRAFT_673184 [Mycena amicta]